MSLYSVYGDDSGSLKDHLLHLSKELVTKNNYYVNFDSSKKTLILHCIVYIAVLN